jgi:hypothetical protein
VAEYEVCACKNVHLDYVLDRWLVGRTSGLNGHTYPAVLSECCTITTKVSGHG